MNMILNYYRVPTVIESQGKLRKKLFIKTSWKIKKISKVTKREKLYPNLGSKYSHRYGSSKLYSYEFPLKN